MIAEIIPAVKTTKTIEVFSYLIPQKFQNDIVIGSIVEIPFGKKRVRGVITKFGLKKTEKFKLKEIISFFPNAQIPPNYLDVAEWIANYYFCSLGEAIALFLPPKILNPRKIQDTRYKIQKIKKLNTEQEKVFQALNNKMKAKRKKPALIYGVTGSGKTEIYIKLAREAIKQNKQVVVLVPEIILTPQTIEKFAQVSGSQICLMHSGLSKSQRYHSYLHFYSGQKPIIIGPRSALMVPAKNIGLIIIDEEQEDAYKQEKTPRYNTADLAHQIAMSQNALLVLGSATPRIESYYKAKTGIYDLYQLKKRYQKLILPPTEIIDLKDEMKKRNYSPISDVLHQAIKDILKANRQILLFLNRRGASTFVSCRDCGYVCNCPNCDIPLIYHSQNNYLRCHHCDQQKTPPSICPKCHGTKIKFFGVGVEKIETEIKQLFPKAKIARVDSEVIRNKDDHRKFYSDFKNKKIDIAIGTQMLAKGLDIPGIDVVGIISADTGLHLPHFRASEKVFRIITQVSGRSGRKDNAGRTIIQSYWPNSAAIKRAAKHDFEGFYDEEILNRKKFNYPPYSKIIRVVSENKSQKKAKLDIDNLAHELSKNNINFIGPGLCFFQRIRDKWRYHIIIKLKTNNEKRKTKEMYLKHQNLTWDVDPNDLV